MVALARLQAMQAMNLVKASSLALQSHSPPTEPRNLETPKVHFKVVTCRVSHKARNPRKNKVAEK